MQTLKTSFIAFQLVTRQSWNGVKTPTNQLSESFSIALPFIWMFQLCNWHMLWFVSEGRTLTFSFKDTNSLDLLICMYFEQVCLWLLRTVCNVSNDLHSHAFQLSLGLPLFFQNIVAWFQKSEWHDFKKSLRSDCQAMWGATGYMWATHEEMMRWFCEIRSY